MTWVKICGVGGAEALEAAIVAGADACGFVFAEESRRFIPPRVAAKLAGRAKGRIARVGVFLDPKPDEVREIVEAVQLDVLQWSGRALPSWAPSLFPEHLHVRAVHLADEDAWPEGLPEAWAYLADARVEGAFGGTGRTAGWAAAADGARRHRLILAGGLGPTNVGAALAAVPAFGVDVSSGVETRGVKDPDKIFSFVKAVRDHDG